MENIITAHFVPLSRQLQELFERGARTGELRPLDARHAVISLMALTVFYFSAAPWIRKVGGTDVFEKEAQVRRKEEVLRFIRYALFNQPEALGR